MSLKDMLSSVALQKYFVYGFFCLHVLSHCQQQYLIVNALQLLEQKKRKKKQLYIINQMYMTTKCLRNQFVVPTHMSTLIMKRRYYRNIYEQYFTIIVVFFLKFVKFFISFFFALFYSVATKFIGHFIRFNRPIIYMTSIQFAVNIELYNQHGYFFLYSKTSPD